MVRDGVMLALELKRGLAEVAAMARSDSGKAQLDWIAAMQQVPGCRAAVVSPENEAMALGWIMERRTATMPDLTVRQAPDRRAPARTGRPRPVADGDRHRNRLQQAARQLRVPRCRHRTGKEAMEPARRAPATRDGRRAWRRERQHIEAIRQCAADGMTANQAAAKLGVTRAAVYSATSRHKIEFGAKAPPLTREQALATETQARRPAQSSTPRRRHVCKVR